MSVLHIALSSLPTGQPSYGIYEQISIEPKYLLLYVESMIKCHNKYRYLHGSPKLRHDPKLTREAFKFADVLARTNIFKHDSLLSKFTGENLCKIRIDTNDVVHAIYKHLLNDSAKACHGWYCQSIHYDSEKEHKTRKQILHFTQLIWKSSKKVGFGMSGIQRTNYIDILRRVTLSADLKITFFREEVIIILRKYAEKRKV
ncbi:hypothetical protein GJ496_004529 [Pomphorhynchus laevis]|nr:hypothetical protein GJ496_004529 [Pomphorhynchus laevis]